MLSRLAGLAALVLAAVVMTSCSGGSSSADGAALRQIEIATSAMEPTIQAGEVVTVDTGAYADGVAPEVGDIVLFAPTVAAGRTCGVDTDPPRPHVSRVVGVAGDRVEVTAEAETLRNGDPLEVDGAIPPNYVLRFPPVPEGRLVVLGDNRPESCDSHQWRRVDGGPAPFVPIENVLGRVVL
ncbi:MAG: signal peptidase I [Thermoleophilia bacterium]